MCDCYAHRSMDIQTPRNVYLSAFYKRSFAYHTVKNRIPIMLTQTLDMLSRNKADIVHQYGEETANDLKIIIGEISKLKYEVQTNKPMQYLNGTSRDIELYNDLISKQVSEEGHATYFHTIFLLTECYVYRRLKSIFELTDTLQDYDYFSINKIEGCIGTVPLMEQLAEYILNVVRSKTDNDLKFEFIKLLKLNLWGNKCDLSIALGKSDKKKGNLFDINKLEEFILCDHSEQVFDCLVDDTSSDIVDIIHDNAGYELFTDLCLADYIISKNLASTVRLYVKTIPWFISDTLPSDFDYLLTSLLKSDNPILTTLCARWNQYLRNGQFVIQKHDFWTLPHEFAYMPKIDPDLYKKISEAKLVIFKGDLNYRKVFGEKNWDPYTPVDEALQGFNPTKLAVVRTLKCDIICGLEKKGLVEEVEKKSPDWLISGEYGVIQFSKKVVKID